MRVYTSLVLHFDRTDRDGLFSGVEMLIYIYNVETNDNTRYLWRTMYGSVRRVIEWIELQFILSCTYGSVNGYQVDQCKTCLHRFAICHARSWSRRLFAEFLSFRTCEPFRRLAVLVLPATVVFTVIAFWSRRQLIVTILCLLFVAAHT